MLNWKLAGVLALTTSAALAQQSYFASWPQGMSPKEVGGKVAEHFVTSPHQYTPTIHYSEAATWYGALSYAQTTGNTKLRDELIQRFEPIMPGGKEEDHTPKRGHVDDSVFGIVPLEIARETHDERFLKYGQPWADRQWENPTAEGLTPETRF